MSTLHEKLVAWLENRADIRAANVDANGVVTIHYEGGPVVVASCDEAGGLHIDEREAGLTRRYAPVPPGAGGGAFGALASGGSAEQNEPGVIRAKTAGTVRVLAIAPGEPVDAGTVLGVIELMKMEIEIVADIAGTVEEVCVGMGDSVERGTLLYRIALE